MDKALTGIAARVADASAGRSHSLYLDGRARP